MMKVTILKKESALIPVRLLKPGDWWMYNDLSGFGYVTSYNEQIVFSESDPPWTRHDPVDSLGSGFVYRIDPPTMTVQAP